MRPMSNSNPRQLVSFHSPFGINIRNACDKALLYAPWTLCLRQLNLIIRSNRQMRLYRSSRLNIRPQWPATHCCAGLLY